MPTTNVELRRMPYPFRSMMAICSDLDETPDRHVYWEITRYLNTAQTTAMGPGLGLEVGNTIYFDMAPNEFAYWNTDDAGRAMVRALIHSGHVDCLHSYGDLATTRRHAGEALEELSRHGCRIEVWVDHRVAPTNFGADIMRGTGDLPGSPAYHADLTSDFGVQYVWRGRVTSVIGQDAPRQLGGIFDARHVLGSTRTLAKEAAKGMLARRRHPKYMLHGPNEVLHRTKLRDGRPVYEFLRSNPYWGGVENADTAAGVAHTLTPRMLDRLSEREGVCVYYTHLGKITRRDEIFPAATRHVLHTLAERSRAGEILVTTTRRLLGYRRAVREVVVKSSAGADGLVIDVSTPSANNAGPRRLTASDLDGLTFYVRDPERAHVRVNGQPLTGLRCNEPDHTGRRSVSVPWPKLEFPSL